MAARSGAPRGHARGARPGAQRAHGPHDELGQRGRRVSAP